MPTPSSGFLTSAACSCGEAASQSFVAGAGRLAACTDAGGRLGTLWLHECCQDDIEKRFRKTAELEDQLLGGIAKLRDTINKFTQDAYIEADIRVREDRIINTILDKAPHHPAQLR
jgi:hypothetical protein